VAEIVLYDTRSGEKRPLLPREPGRIGIYACGPTVYGRIHVGNARPYVVFSQLKRFLAQTGYDVTLVINITDINDKIYAAAEVEEIPSEQLARAMTDAYVADTDRLELGRPDHEPRASDLVDGMVAYIADLIEAGCAYEAGGDVFFGVRSDPQYGSLSHRDVDAMDQGEDVEGAQRKRDPLDFALWKAHKPDEDTFWPSPWGPGRPGWHIECSVMSEQLLGVGFDIHGGGIDLAFPHHENEAAQTRCARGTELARIWVHNGMLQSEGEKMAKSVGNIAPLFEVLDEHGRDALIMYFCGGHYRQPITFNDEVLAQARANVERVREVARRLEFGASPPDMREQRDRFFAALADDFNTAEALAELWAWVREANRREPPIGDVDLREMLTVLGLENLLDASADAPEDVVELARQRLEARSSRDFARADELRDAIAARGWTVRDRPDGFDLVPA
jgi:cysteinyl-tRNA synthetase